MQRINCSLTNNWVNTVDKQDFADKLEPKSFVNTTGF